MHNASKKGLAAAAIAGLAVVPFASQSASAAPAGLHVVKTLTTAYAGGLQFAVDGSRVVVADAATGTLDAVGGSTPLSKSIGTQGSGVAIDPDTHALAFTSTNDNHSRTTLTIRTPGAKTVVADLAGFEKTVNPDQHVHYGVTLPQSQCVIDALTIPSEFGGPPTPAAYTGAVDSHPYAVASLGHGAWAVADAGGNDVVKVSRSGHVSLLGVLPRQSTVITAEIAAENGAPDCVIGVTYHSEAVPTDVEVGPHGKLIVSTLSGGIAAGNVYRLNPDNGRSKRLVGGLIGSTNVAVSPGGTVYVAELFTGNISRVAHHTATPVANLAGVAAIEYSRGHLYASTAPGQVGPPAPGSVVKLG